MKPMGFENVLQLFYFLYKISAQGVYFLKYNVIMKEHCTIQPEKQAVVMQCYFTYNHMTAKQINIQEALSLYTQNTNKYICNFFQSLKEILRRSVEHNSRCWFL